MSPADDKAGRRRIRRVVVTIDAEQREAMEAAARLARSLRAELLGLYVASTELEAAASLPGFRLVSPSGRTTQPLAASEWRRTFRATEAAARRAFEEVARRHGVTVSVRVERGDLPDRLLALTEAGDLLALGLRRGRRGDPPRMRPWAEELSRAASCSVVLLRGEPAPDAPVVALFEGGESALSTGHALADADRRPLTVLAIGPDEATARARAEEAAARLSEGVIPVHVQPVVAADERDLRSELARQACSILVLDRAGPVARAFALDAFLANHPCSAVVLA